MISETIDKRYYTIGEVATMLNKKAHNIRQWSNEFGMNPKRNRKGTRFFTKQQFEKLSQINAMLSHGRSTFRLLKTIL
jgi:DNA-binding transcriptional MerR regulator